MNDRFCFRSVRGDCVWFVEHRNMPVDDAITLITRSFDKYMLDRRERTEGHGAGAGRAPPPASQEGQSFLPATPRIQQLLDLLADRRHLTAAELTLVIDYLVERRHQLEPSRGISARPGWLKVCIFGPCHMYRVQRCGLLLQMFRGLCVYVCLSVCPLVTAISCAKTAEPVEMHVLGGAQILTRGRGNVFVGRASPIPLLSVGHIGHEPKLLGRWQQRCCHSLSVLQQLL